MRISDYEKRREENMAQLAAMKTRLESIEREPDTEEKYEKFKIENDLYIKTINDTIKLNDALIKSNKERIKKLKERIKKNKAQIKKSQQHIVYNDQYNTPLSKNAAQTQNKKKRSKNTSLEKEIWRTAQAELRRKQAQARQDRGHEDDICEECGSKDLKKTGIETMDILRPRLHLGP